MFRRCRILAFALSLFLVLSSAAFAAEGDTVLFGSDGSGYSEVYIDYAVAAGDTLYLCTWDDLYTYKLGDDAPEKFLKLSEEYTPSEEPAAAATSAPVESIEGTSETAEEADWPTHLVCPFMYQGKLHMIYESTGEIKVLEGDRFAETGLKVDLSTNTQGYSTLSNYLTSIFEHENKLYVLARVDMNDWDAPLELWVVDPQTGGHEVIKTELALKGVCAYEPGKLLGWTQADWGSVPGEYNEENYYPRLAVLDAVTGKTLEGPVIANSSSSSLCGPIYDANSGMIYYASQNKLLRKSSLSAEPEVLSYFTREIYQSSSPISILSGSHLVLPTYEGVYIRNIATGAVAGKPLRIANHYMSDASSAFMRDNPDIPLDFVNVDGLYGASADEIAQLIGSGEDSIDIYLISGTSNVRQLLEKGYAQDLSGSEAIMRALDRMYEPIRDAISVDGKPMGFPAYVSPSLWMYNKEKFDELGLEFPETYSDFIDLYERWERELADENPSITFIIDYGQSENRFKQQMFYGVISQYVLEFDTSDQPLKFNTPEFLEAMRKVEALPGELETENGAYSYEYSEDLVLLLQMYFGFERYNSDGGTSTPAYSPRISANSDPGISIYLNLFIINPNSANVDNAIKYLEYMTEHGEHSAMLAMYPDFNEPLKEEWAIQNLEYAEKQLADYQEMVVTDENRRDVEEMIKEAERWVEESKSYLWRIKQETIDDYRALVEDSRIFVESTGWVSLFSSGSASKEILDLIERYTKGQIDLDQMVRELDQKTQMIYLEQQ